MVSCRFSKKSIFPCLLKGFSTHFSCNFPHISHIFPDFSHSFPRCCPDFYRNFPHFSTCFPHFSRFFPQFSQIFPDVPTVFPDFFQIFPNFFPRSVHRLSRSSQVTGGPRGRTAADAQTPGRSVLATGLARGSSGVIITDFIMDFDRQKG